MVTSDFRPEVEIRPFRACSVHPDIIIGTVRSLRTQLCGRYHVPQNAFLVYIYIIQGSFYFGPPSRCCIFMHGCLYANKIVPDVFCFSYVTRSSDKTHFCTAASPYGIKCIMLYVCVFSVFYNYFMGSPALMGCGLYRQPTVINGE